MARNGSGVYSLPANTAAVSGDPVSSSKFNTLVEDLEAVLNTARPVVKGGTGSTTAAGARTELGLEIGTNVLAYDAGLSSIAGLTTAANKMIYTTAADTYAVADLSAFARTILDDADAAAVRATIGAGSGSGDMLAANNLSEVNATTARSNLGLGSMALETATDYAALSGAQFTGNVGVGGAASVQFQVVSASAATEAIRVSNSGNSARFHIFPGELQSQNSTLTLNAADGNGIIFENSSTEIGRITSTGFGLGTTTPSVKLDVVGTVHGSNFYVANSGGTIGSQNATAGAAIQFFGTAEFMAGFTNGSERWRVDSSGNMGIGASVPTAKLHVNGDLQARATSSSGVSGTLTQASHLEGHSNALSGNITMPTAAAGCHAVFTAGSSARTITRGSIQMYVNGVDSASATIPARGMCAVVFETFNVCYLSGDVS